MEAQESAVRWIEVRNGERRYSTVCGFEGMCPQKEERESRKEKMREWLSGGVSPCQGEGRGFESRLALFFIRRQVLISQDSWRFLSYQ